MAIILTQQTPLQQEELIVQQSQVLSDFDEIKTFLDILRDYQIPKLTETKQKIVSLGSLRSDTLNNSNPRFVSN
jgi:hypothetical protein